ncbi:ubiquinol-cytochrome C chaperone family protein [Ferruginivarius sediminum]|uniref:ubiquinol-cytochrome C chaperone family protein n=1 Tax=Ferruginivarius sediminum TaxID=2661937 RepID=UPI001F4D8350|nr:ubiquinol-cytochrome C chaperone family protein [Ferruginivarius sediminum]
MRQAREPVFYRGFHIPDTLDGRFELISLHVFLILHRLKDQREQTDELAQALFDTMFADMDRSLREMGAGDLGVGPRVKKMAQAFYGRIAAYDAGLAAENGRLEEAVRRNLYGTVDDPGSAAVAAMSGYMRRQADILRGQDLRHIAAGQVRFAEPATQSASES